MLTTALMAPAHALATEPVRHELRVVLDPQAHRVEVRDTITLADESSPVRFVLHGGLRPELAGAGSLTLLDRRRGPGGVPLERYEIAPAPGERTFTLRYAGEIHHPVARAGEAYGRGFDVSPGIVSAEGVYLSSASHWYPALADTLVSFDLEVTLPPGWRSMSQGRREREEGARPRERWRIDAPQDGVFLIAGPFTEYRRSAGTVDAMVLLREPEPALAERYLEATGRYVEMYRQLIGPYPYSKFALVENFWETGYGMPSFTLLGPRVIRLPFILHSSYPHEILHNWWGNGVYVDYGSGNWSEGLTSYLADHLIKEQRGQGVAYRRAALQKYADYVRDGRDFPLREFRGRHGSVSEAVGYGKTMMVFHMLRRRLGDDRFREGLRRLYREQRFQVTSFDDVAASFAAAAGEPLDAFFTQWIERTGAPALRVRDAEVHRAGERHVLEATLEQTQAGEPYALQVPLAVHLAGGAVEQREIDVDRRTTRIELTLPARPVRLEIDPEFDLFRRLDRAEIPPALSQMLGADEVLFVLPAAAPAPVREGYRALVRAWRRGRGSTPEIRDDADLDALPADRSVWLLGWENRFRPVLEAALGDHDFEARGDRVRIGGDALGRDEDAVVAVARHPADPEHALAWVALDNLAAIPGLARKLPHYGRYGYLGFRGDEPTNVAKGEWPVIASPMTVVLSEQAGPLAPLATRPALIHPASREGTLTVAGRPAEAGRGGGTRRASLGTVPDFAYGGSGVRLSGVVEGSPAQAAGLREGDVIVALGERGIDDLQGFADALRGLEPGARVTLRLLRDGESLSVEARLVAR